LIFRRVSKFDAITCQIIRLKCTKFDFRCGSAPDPAGEAYSNPLDPLAVFKMPTSKERAEENGGNGRGKGKGGQGRGQTSPQIF